MIIIILIIIFILFAIIYNHNKNKPKIVYDNFTFFEGALGSLKTTLLTFFSVAERTKRVIYNKLIANKIMSILLTILLYLMPLFNLIPIFISIFDKKLFVIKLNKRGVKIYSSFPIRYRKYILFGKWQYSLVVDITLFTWLYKYDPDNIFALDELGYWFPPDTNLKGNAIMTDKVKVFGITWLRHAISPCCFCASQSIDEVNISFRRKIQHIYRLSNGKKIFWRISKVDFVEIQRSEDSGSIITTFNSNTMTYTCNRFVFWYPKNNFDSRYGRRFYDLKEQIRKEITYNYDNLLKYLGLKAGDSWEELVYFNDKKYTNLMEIEA